MSNGPHRGHKICLGCGYILDLLPGNRCPECGRFFDPDDVQSFGPRETTGGACANGVLFLVAAVLASPLLWVSMYSYPFWSLAAILTDGFVVSAGLILLAKHRCRYRPLMVCAIVVAGLSLVEPLLIPRLYD